MTQKRKDIVIRIKTNTYDRIREIAIDATYDEVVSKALDLLEMLKHQRPVYAVADKLFTDLATARGEAIMNAAKYGSTPHMPAIFIKIGEDKLDATPQS